MTSRLMLLCQGATMATRAASFPADDPLEQRAQSRVTALRPIGWRADRACASPMLAARQTAEALGLAAEEDAGLRDLDYGRWAGQRIADVGREQPEDLAQWLGDPGFDGHGGESIAALLARAGAWLDQQSAMRGRTVAITHASVVRAMMLHVLDAPPAAFWRVDVEPLTLTDIRHDGRRWAVRSCGLPWSPDTVAFEKEIPA
jgi:broad specificity phosphatase PhoE